MICSRRRFLALTAALTILPAGLSACQFPAAAGGPAFKSGSYKNLFTERGHDQATISAKIDAAWQSLFASTDDDRRVYYAAGNNEDGPLAYVKDIGNDDIRTEGMSYGMMIAVQLNKQAEFNAIWNWAKTYMQHQDGGWQGYFSWHNKDDGSKLDQGPAPDGETWFAMALLFAAGRWGNGQGRYNYRAEADAILNAMLHKTDINPGGTVIKNMFNAQEHMVVFVPNDFGATFTDPSYHLPAFYELWGRWAAGYKDQQQDRQFWLDAAKTSRDFFQKACHPTTGLAPDYAHFDGTPVTLDGHDAFRFDAFRTISNIAVDYAWFGADPREQELCDRLQGFFAQNPNYVNQYSLDGKPLSKDRSPGLIAMNAVASLAATNRERAGLFVDELWKLEPPTGKWRYYDGLLYLIALLHVSGNFRIYTPAT